MATEKQTAYAATVRPIVAQRIAIAAERMRATVPTIAPEKLPATPAAMLAAAERAVAIAETADAALILDLHTASQGRSGMLTVEQDHLYYTAFILALAGVQPRDDYSRRMAAIAARA